jgi:type IX secretion system PorP/SprF family membrane protein
MGRKSAIVFLLSGMVIQDKLFAQNTFSQFYSSPLTVNASNTGRFDGDYRVGGIYRNEKNSAGLSSQASFFYDTRILGSFVPENDKVAIGILAGFEKNSNNGTFKKSNIAFSLGYHKSLNEDGSEQISLGFQLGFTNQSLELPPYIFEDQLTNWLRSGYTGLQYIQSKNINFSYPDLHIGAGYQVKLNDANRITAGVSILHANSPQRIFNGGEFKLTPVGSLQLGWDYTIDPENKFYTSLLVDYTRQDQLQNIYANLLYRIRVRETGYKVGAGALFRKSTIKGDAIIPCLALYYSGFVLNATYDINISGRTMARRGAFEMSLLYTGLRRRQ